MLVWEALKTEEERLVTKQELWRILEAIFGRRELCLAATAEYWLKKLLKLWEITY